MKAILVLEDGRHWEGQAIGAAGTSFGEAVFNTSMTGYQEILTDPSYAGQILTFTYPLIGNYGITPLDEESDNTQVAGLVVRELAEVPSNWRSGGALNAYLRTNGIIAMQGVDTRSLAKHLRISGVMMAGISTEHDVDTLLRMVRAAPHYSTFDYVRERSVTEPTPWTGGHGHNPLRDRWASEAPSRRLHRVALLDLGVKRNIMRSLAALGVEITAWPCTSSAGEMLATRPDGVVISPGPGDPARLDYAVDTVRQLAVSGVPMAGICLGHHLLAYAFGGTTFKLKFGHRGANHPVRNLRSGRVSITSQNHGYAVAPDGLEGSGLEVESINLNDGTVEGLRHVEYPVFSIQYHPEASPGPRDRAGAFDEFVNMMGGRSTPPAPLP